MCNHFVAAASAASVAAAAAAAAAAAVLLFLSAPRRFSYVAELSSCSLYTGTVVGGSGSVESSELDCNVKHDVSALYTYVGCFRDQGRLGVDRDLPRFGESFCLLTFLH